MLYNFLGQTINIGEIVGDLVQYNTVPNILFTGNVSSIWNPVTYMLANGGIPESDYTYTIPVPDAGANFYIAVRYTDANHFRVGYLYLDTFLEASLVYHDSGTLIDKRNIKEEDCLINGLVFTHCLVASERYAFMFDTFGWGVGCNDPMTNSHPITSFNTGGYEMYDDPYYHERYIWDETGECYWQFIAGEQKFWFDGQMVTPITRYLLDAYGEEVSAFDEDYSNPDGGLGSDYNFYSDMIDFSPLPSISIMDAGIASMWNPTPQQMNDFTNFLWSDSFLDNILKLIADPLDNVIEFGVVPFQIPAAYLGNSKVVSVGNVSTGVNMVPLTKQYVTYDCGSVQIPGAWKTMMDYEPMTFCSLFLPFIGFMPITANEVINASKVQVRYNIDLLSGDCIAEVKIVKNFPKGVSLNSVVYHKTGNLLQQMPLTAANYGRMYTQLLHNASSFGANLMGGNVIGAVDSVLNVPSIDLERTNAYTGSSGILGCEQPYILLSQPVQVFDSLYPKYEGYPCYLHKKLDDVSGYCKVESVIDNAISATDTEKAEIEALLKEGVYL